MELLDFNDYNALSVNMRILRKRMGLSQEDLAKKVGLNRGNIASYEKGTAEPKLCNLLRFSQLFGVSIHDLTQRDMSCDCTYEAAFTNYLRLNNENVEELNDFTNQAQEFSEVFEGISKCYDFIASKNQHEITPVTKMIDGQYGQLQHLTQQVLKAHHELLEFVKCRLKE